MLRTLRIFLRVMVGFCLANLISGVSLTLSVIPISEILQKTNQLQEILQLALMTAIQSAMFSLPIALPLFTLYEWFDVRGVGIYVLSGIGISAVAYLLFFADVSAASTLLDDSSFLSLLLSGFFAGVTYWAVAGRIKGSFKPLKE